MISGASEKELNIANIRADIMIALNEKYGNYDLLNELDKYQEDEKQQLINWLEDKIKEKNNILERLEGTGSVRISILQSQIKELQEVLNFVNKGGKDE